MRTLGYIFIIGGTVMMCYAGYSAISHLAGLYARVQADPLAEPAESEAEVPKKMLKALGAGLPGVGFFIGGGVLLRVSAVRGRTRGRLVARPTVGFNRKASPWQRP